MDYTYLESCKAGATYNFVTEVPIRGLLDISDITTPTGGSIRFRVAPNTVDFTDFLESNSLPFSIDQRFDPVVEIEFKPTVDVDNPVFTIIGSDDIPYEFVSLDSTAYQDIDPLSYRFEKLWLNLFRKLYLEGIVPSYIDRDGPAYVPYFKSVAIINALNISLSEFYLGDLTGDRLRGFLEQKSLLICEDATDVELQDIRDRQFEIIRNRGSVNLIEELRSYLCTEECDPFMFEYAPRFMSGWTLDRSSPNYRGREHYQLNLAPTKGDGIYPDDGLNTLGNVAFLSDIGLGFLVNEDGDRILLSENLPTLDYDGGRIILEFQENRDVVCLGDVGNETSYLIQEDSQGKIAQENTNPSLDSGITLESGSPTLNAATSSISFEICPYFNTNIDWEIRFWALTDQDSGISLSIQTPDGSFIHSSDDANDLPVSFKNIVEPTVLGKQGKWTRFRIPIQSKDTLVKMRDMPSGISNYIRINPDSTDDKTTIRVTIANPYSGKLCLDKLSFGPTALDTQGARLDAYNSATLVYIDKFEQSDTLLFNDTILNYLLPYGSTFTAKRYNKD